MTWLSNVVNVVMLLPEDFDNAEVWKKFHTPELSTFIMFKISNQKQNNFFTQEQITVPWMLLISWIV